MIARATANWRGDDGLCLSASWNVDAFGRSGGNFGDVSVGWETRLGTHTAAGMGAVLSLAGDRYLRSCDGIHAAQAARTGDPLYVPGAGLRGVAVSATARTRRGPGWVLLGGVGVSRLPGQAARSPRTKASNGGGMNLGPARRF